jgi:putative ABC transport system ATP-binding protein
MEVDQPGNPRGGAALIELQDIDFQYPVIGGFGIHIPRLSISAGECVAVVGPSGSGKTTLLGLLAGILAPVRGATVINDINIGVLDDGQRRRFRIQHIGQVFQAFELLHYLTVVENVMLPHYIDASGADRKEARRRALELLSDVGLGPKADSRPGELSQGEQQRVAVCRAMLNQPALLLADEPTGNLDQANKQNVVDLLLDQALRNHSTLLMVTHDQSLLGSFSTVLDIQSMVRVTTRPGVEAA